MVKTDSRTGRCVLSVAHCAGMVDLVALPVWVGTLIARYGFDPQQAGGLVTLFLAGAVVSSLFFASRFNRLRDRRRITATAGFAASALVFLLLSATRDFTSMALLHLLGGAATGCALSFTHGTIGRSTNPHRLFAIAGIGMGFFGIAFLATSPQVVAAFGGPALFRLFAGVMAVAAVACAIGFPVVDSAESDTVMQAATPLDTKIWFAVFGVACMALTQSMMFSFVERIGADRGFGFAAVTGVLIALGFVNLFPSPLAALLQHRLPAHRVLLGGPMAQAVLALLITQTSAFAPYAFGTVMFVSLMIFTHTFAFGRLAALDPSGRAVAATPAMLMVGAAIGPLLGGTLVKLEGYGSLGVAALVVSAAAVAAFFQLRPERHLPSSTPGVSR